MAAVGGAYADHSSKAHAYSPQTMSISGSNLSRETTARRSSGSVRDKSNQTLKSTTRNNGAVDNQISSKMFFEGPSPRPLPNGPGPLNIRGEKTTIKQTLQNYKNNLASSSRQSRQDGSGPIRALGQVSSGARGTSKGTPEKDRMYFGNLSEKFVGTSGIRPRRSASQVNIPSSSSKSSIVDDKNCFDGIARVSGGGGNDRNSALRNVNSHNDNADDAMDLSTTMNSDRNGRMRLREVPSATTAAAAAVAVSSPKSTKPTAKSKNLDQVVDERGFGQLRLSPPDSSRGLVGLENLGNTCFMNSILQCLSNTRLLLEFCLGSNYSSDVNTRTSSMKGSMIKAYANLMESMWKSHGSASVVSPTDFKYHISKFARNFVGTREHDAHEFLVYLLEGLHEDLNRIHEKKKRFIDCGDQVETISAPEKARLSWQRYIECDNSKIIDIFMGQLRSALTCKKCGYVSNTFEPFLALSLPIKQAGSQVSLYDCFKLFSLEETLDGDNKPKCAKCRTRNACTKQMSLQKFPKVLVIHLMRFKQGTSSKLNTQVSCPVSGLNLTQFTTTSSSCSSAVYNLFAISNHSGTPLSGHYTAYAKNPYSNQWHIFNDSRVTSISLSSVNMSEAYLLFYELQDPSLSS